MKVKSVDVPISGRGISKLKMVLLSYLMVCGVVSSSNGKDVLAANGELAVDTEAIKRILQNINGKLRTVAIENKLTGKRLKVEGPEFVLTWGKGKKLSSDDFRLVSLKKSEKGAIAKLEYPKLNLVVEITYSKSAKGPWLKKEIKFINNGEHAFLLRTLEVEHLKVVPEKVIYTVSEKARPSDVSSWGQPVYTESLWLGMEFPASRNYADSNNFILLKHHPGFRIEPGEVYKSKRAVLGAGALGQTRESFFKYVATLAPRKVVPKMHLYWNGYLVVKPPRLKQGLKMIELAKKLKDETGFTFDAWTYDAARSMYREDGLYIPREPKLWAETQKALKPMDTRLGFWVSFAGVYNAPTHTWGEAQGFELQKTASKGDRGKGYWDQKGRGGAYCLAGPRYFSALKDRLEDIVRTYDMGSINFDGMSWKKGFGCNEPGHGHLVGHGDDAGVFGCERIVENKLKIFRSLRAIQPEIILDLFICSEWGSPWWLMELDGVHTVYGDTVPANIPSPWLRDELITVRDIQLFNEHRVKKVQFPLWAEDLYGTQVRKDHMIDGVKVYGEAYEKRWEDEYVMALPGRGAINANLMCSDLNMLEVSRGGFPFLGKVALWTRANQAIYLDFHLFGGNPKDREVFGYSHADGKGRAVVALRNPYIIAQKYSLELGKNLGLKPSKEDYFVNVVYPYRETYAPMPFGGKVDIPIQDYQVLLLEVRRRSRQFEEISEPGRWDLAENGQLLRLDKSPCAKPSGSLSLEGQGGALELSGSLVVPETASKGQIQIFLDPVLKERPKGSKHKELNLTAKVFVDGAEVKTEFHKRTGKNQQDWILVDLDPGIHDLKVSINSDKAGKIKVGAWLLAHYKLKGEKSSVKVKDPDKFFPVFAADEDRRMCTLLEPAKVASDIHP